MRKIAVVFVSLLLITSLALGQGVTIAPKTTIAPNTTVFPGTAGSSTWSLVQIKFWDGTNGSGGGTCSVAGTTCAVTVSAVAAGNILACGFVYFDGTSHTLTNCGGGETWTICPAPTCAVIGGGTTTGADGRFVLSAVGGETTITCTVNSAPSGYFGCAIAEFHYTGPSASIDKVGTAATTACTACAGVTLTLTGSNDAIFTWGAPNNNFTAITSPYSTNAHFYGGTVEAVSINTASGTAPTVTQDVSGQVAIASIAIKGN